MSHVTRSILLACWWALGSALAPVCVANTVSPLSTAHASNVGAGMSQWTIRDAAGTWDALRSMTTSPVSATSSGALTVQTAAKVPTKHGAVDAVVKREIPYSKLVSPWKKALKAVPLLGTGLVVVELLNESCIRPLGGTGAFEQCYTREQEAPAEVRWAYSRAGGQTSYYSSAQQACDANKLAGYEYVTTITQADTVTCRYKKDVLNQQGEVVGTNYSVVTSLKTYWCGTEQLTVNPYVCPTKVIEGYEPVDSGVAESALDNPPSGTPDHVRDKVFKLWEELKNLPDDLPQDARSVDATGLSSPTITPKTPADTAKVGPKTTETTSTGTKVTQETATVTYQGNTTTVINNTTVTNINNEGDIIDESTSSEQGPTDCEKNPSAIACLELGEPPSGDVPRRDEAWEVTAESLPGGACPGGFVWPVPGNPEFSWQPLCDRLPAVRAVLLVLASVLAAWIVVGGLQS